MKNTYLHAVDTRVLSEIYKGYRIWVGYSDQGYLGRITQRDLLIAEYEGANIDLIMTNLKDIVDSVLIDLQHIGKMYSNK